MTYRQLELAAIAVQAAGTARFPLHLRPTQVFSICSNDSQNENFSHAQSRTTT